MADADDQENEEDDKDEDLNKNTVEHADADVRCPKHGAWSVLLKPLLLLVACSCVQGVIVVSSLAQGCLNHQSCRPIPFTSGHAPTIRLSIRAHCSVWVGHSSTVVPSAWKAGMCNGPLAQ